MQQRKDPDPPATLATGGCDECDNGCWFCDRETWFYWHATWAKCAVPNERDEKQVIVFPDNMEELEIVVPGERLFWGHDPVLNLVVVSFYNGSLDRQEPFEWVAGTSYAVGDYHRVQIPDRYFQALDRDEDLETRAVVGDADPLRADTWYHMVTTLHHESERMAFLVPDGRLTKLTRNPGLHSKGNSPP